MSTCGIYYLKQVPTFLGVMLVITYGDWSQPQFISEGDICWLLASVLFWAIYTTYGKKCMSSIMAVFATVIAFFRWNQGPEK